MSKKLTLEVSRVTANLLKSNPPQLHVQAFGIVSSGGWQDGELIPAVYVTPPADGVQEFVFVATPPTGPATQVFSSIEANHTLSPSPAWVTGVRIRASNSCLELKELKEQTKVCLKGTLTDEGVECQAFRDSAGHLYTLVGNLEGFSVGDEVFLSGTITEISFCMQGTTISVSWIGMGCKCI